MISNNVWKIFIFLAVVDSVSRASETGPDNLNAHSGYYCYVRCLAHCIEQLGAHALDNECQSECTEMNKDDLCLKDDTNCWYTCKNTLQVSSASVPSPPRNVSVAYVTTPQPTPWVADVQWLPSERANLYIVQSLDTTDPFNTWTKGGMSKNLTTSTYWQFTKPSLCPEYAFRVASVNEYGVSSFSEIVNLSSPIPVVPAALYSMQSAELLQVPFINVTTGGREPLYNTTVQLIINFTPPPNWNLDTEINKVRANLHVLKCNSQQPQGSFSSLIRQRPGESEFEVRLPGYVAEDQGDCKLIFTVDSLYSKCDPTTPVQYPELPIGQQVPGFQLQLSCKNIRGSVCPYSAISKDPSCGVRNIFVNTHTNDNQSYLANSSISFDRVLTPNFLKLLCVIVHTFFAVF